MNNLQLLRMDNMTEDETVMREMGELEIAGAMTYLYTLCKEYDTSEFGESYTSFDAVDSDTYYCNKKLEINGDGYVLRDSEGNLVRLHAVFMFEGNRCDLWGHATYNLEFEDEEQEMFLVRI